MGSRWNSALLLAAAFSAGQQELSLSLSLWSLSLVSLSLSLVSLSLSLSLVSLCLISLCLWSLSLSGLPRSGLSLSVCACTFFSFARRQLRLVASVLRH